THWPASSDSTLPPPLRSSGPPRQLPSVPPRRSSDLGGTPKASSKAHGVHSGRSAMRRSHSARSRRISSIASRHTRSIAGASRSRSEEHTSELQSRENLVGRPLLERENREIPPGSQRA